MIILIINKKKKSLEEHTAKAFCQRQRQSIYEENKDLKGRKEKVALSHSTRTRACHKEPPSPRHLHCQ
jgi:hypothetical protein